MSGNERSFLVACCEEFEVVSESDTVSDRYRIFIVFEFIEHGEMRLPLSQPTPNRSLTPYHFVPPDLKTLLSTMPSPFLTSEIKTLLLQLLSAIAACHDNWIVHRDLKTSNLLMNNR